MNLNSPVALWTPFIAMSLLTWLINKTLWFIEQYDIVLYVFGIISVGLAIRVLAHTGPKVWAIVGVIAGLVIGQFWALERGIILLFWSVRGFAP